ncbi:MAG: RagB/SusD family nutrient uptake outer membrane protein [Tannerella sp.]|jgi:hypothetical protein|nr:RagB/SusD family nutrient uptake outer membrane protein [Tannerella sp.]
MNTKLLFCKWICGIALFVLAACSDFMEKEPYDIITPDKVWKDPKLINAVLVKLYDQMQLEDFNYLYDAAWRIIRPSTMSDEATGSYQKDPFFDNPNATCTYPDELFGTFSGLYQGIRNCNDFLEQLETATLSESEKTALNAEVRFIRAWHYFSLVKRYGGVPLVEKAQVYNGPEQQEELQLPRAKEEDVYAFIVNECKAVADKLPWQTGDAARYRADRGAVWSLCSRSALYAGSIAKYGKVELDGVVGIQASKATDFYQAAYDASKTVIESGVYVLYNKKPDDKAQNYGEMFQTGNGDNGEYIFQKQYSVAGGKGHGWDYYNTPYSYVSGWGCGVTPTLELVEEYECMDGSAGMLKLTDANGQPIKYDNVMDVFADKDPRLTASVYLPGSPCRGTSIEWLRGIINSTGEKITTVKPQTIETYTDPGTGETYNISGKDGGADAGDPSKTSFYQRKFADESLTDFGSGTSETPWPVFRLAEMYLNLAEAAVEMGREQDALSATNAIRERAGIAPLSSIDIQKVRHERKIELAFEHHRFWDMRRWRIAALDASQGGLNGYRGKGLYPYLDVRDNKYVFYTGETPKQVRIFLEKNYYIKIGSSDLNSNPKMVQNPGYTN